MIKFLNLFSVMCSDHFIRNRIHVINSFSLQLIDDSSRFCWVYLKKHKSDVHRLIPRLCAMVHNQFSSSIKMFRSDNASELVRCHSFLDNNS